MLLPEFVKGPRECKNWKQDTHPDDCLRYINPKRPSQTMHCDNCIANYQRNWWQANKEVAAQSSRDQREHWPEKHNGKTYNRHMAEYRASRPERTRELNKLHQANKRARDAAKRVATAPPNLQSK